MKRLTNFKPGMGTMTKEFWATGSSPIVVTLNPLDKAAQLTLSNGDLTILKTGANGRAMIRATHGISSGKGYFEMTATYKQAQGFCIGLCDKTYAGDMITHIGFETGQISWYTTNTVKRVYQDGSYSTQSTGENYVTGETVGCAFDIDDGKMYMCDDLGTWLNGADPVAGTNTEPEWQGMDSGPWYPGLSLYDNPDSMTINFGASAFVHGAPSGYVSYNDLVTSQQ